MFVFTSGNRVELIPVIVSSCWNKSIQEVAEKTDWVVLHASTPPTFENAPCDDPYTWSNELHCVNWRPIWWLFYRHTCIIVHLVSLNISNKPLRLIILISSDCQHKQTKHGIDFYKFIYIFALNILLKLFLCGRLDWSVGFLPVSMAYMILKWVKNKKIHLTRLVITKVGCHVGIRRK